MMSLDKVHYIEVHGVWAPGMNEMLEAARREVARA